LLPEYRSQPECRWLPRRRAAQKIPTSRTTTRVQKGPHRAMIPTHSSPSTESKSQRSSQRAHETPSAWWGRSATTCYLPSCPGRGGLSQVGGLGGGSASANRLSSALSTEITHS